nr:MAG TPA: hypothetical protein [Caudoviricetes sp.]
MFCKETSVSLKGPLISSGIAKNLNTYSGLYSSFAKSKILIVNSSFGEI